MNVLYKEIWDLVEQKKSIFNIPLWIGESIDLYDPLP